jgi:hypothetical protein
MQESSYENRVQPRRLPDDAPNILIVLIDDAGPGLPDSGRPQREIHTAPLGTSRLELGFGRDCCAHRLP